jgi:hypothetical protein
VHEILLNKRLSYPCCFACNLRAISRPCQCHMQQRLQAEARAARYASPRPAPRRNRRCACSVAAGASTSSRARPSSSGASRRIAQLRMQALCADTIAHRRWYFVVCTASTEFCSACVKRVNADQGRFAAAVHHPCFRRVLVSLTLCQPNIQPCC